MHDADLTLVTVPGWGDSGPQHWQSLWERGYPFSRRVVQPDWFSTDAAAWQAAVAATLAEIDGPVVLAAHSLGCHAVLNWWAAASLVEQRQAKGLLLVAPPALPFEETVLRSAGMLAEGEAMPALPGFAAPAAVQPACAGFVVASRNDPFCSFAQAQALAAGWGLRLIDAGETGHINADSGLRDWPLGQRLLQRLMLG